MWLLAVIAVVKWTSLAFYLQHSSIRRSVFVLKSSKKLSLLTTWTIDRRVSNFMGGPGTRGFQAISSFDSQAVDGTINGVARLVEMEVEGSTENTEWANTNLRCSDWVRVVALLCWFLVRSNI